jgi:periplasmic divalent cation tolerance protein
MASAENPALVVVYVTTPNSETSKLIAQGLVSSGLAACVNILPGVTSVYRWQGAVNSDTEELLFIKSTAQHLPALTQAVLRMHPYDTPEVLAVPAVGGSAAYIQWLVASADGKAIAQSTPETIQ